MDDDVIGQWLVRSETGPTWVPVELVDAFGLHSNCFSLGQGPDEADMLSGLMIGSPPADLGPTMMGLWPISRRPRIGQLKVEMMFSDGSMFLSVEVGVGEPLVWFVRP